MGQSRTGTWTWGFVRHGKDFALYPKKNRMSLIDHSKSSEQKRLAIAREGSGRHKRGFADAEVRNGGVLGRMVSVQMG